jgi:hypothetical protein
VDVGEVAAQSGVPFRGGEGADKLKGIGLDLVAVLRAVRWAAGLVRISDHQSCLLELMQGEPADGLTRVRRPFLLVVFRGELHDGSYTQEGLLGVRPLPLWREIQKGEECECGAFILLFFGQPEGCKYRLGFCDATLENAFFHRSL